MDEFEVGQLVKVAGLRGTFTVKEIRDDGDITVFGGTSGREKWLTFTANRIKPMAIRKGRKS